MSWLKSDIDAGQFSKFSMGGHLWRCAVSRGSSGGLFFGASRCTANCWNNIEKARSYPQSAMTLLPVKAEIASCTCPFFTPSGHSAFAEVRAFW